MLDLHAAERYVLGRETPAGGYCFYRVPAWGLEEANAPDTLAAVEALRILGSEVPNPGRTARWLRSLQGADGTFATLMIGWSAVRALMALGSGPALPFDDWLHDWAHVLLDDVANPSRQWRGALLAMMRLIELHVLAGTTFGAPERAALAAILTRAQTPEGGWAIPGADLETTGVAVEIVDQVSFGAGGGALLGADGADSLSELLDRCEDERIGLRLAPSAHATTAGALWGGLVSLRHLGRGPRHPDAIGESLALLQRPDGGLGTRHRAISTLLDTWLGLRAWQLLEQEREAAR